MPLLYKAITWWTDAYHVYTLDGTRIGIVNLRTVRIPGREDRMIWKAHNIHFFSIRGEYSSRTEAAEAIPQGTIKHTSEALVGAH